MEPACDSAIVLRNMALTDALSMQRTMTSLREAALAEIIKKLGSMNPDKMIEVLKIMNSTDSLTSYANLIEKIDEGIDKTAIISERVGCSEK